jgi:hypothetical protein
MAAWSTVVWMNKDMPVVRVVNHGVAGCYRSSFWDNTNKRYLSGVVKSTVTGATAISAAAHAGGALTAGETLAARVAPPNFNAINDYEYKNAGIDLGSVTAINPAYTNICAVNYGIPGPSAQINEDGTIVYTVVDLELASNDFTDIVTSADVTVTGDVTATTGTNYDPYADNGGIAYAMPLAVGPLASKYFYVGGAALGPWGMIAAAIAGNYTAFVVQIQSIVTQYIPGPSGRLYTPMLHIKNPAQPGGQPLANWELPMPTHRKSTNTISELDPNSRGYTYVFAANAGSGNTIDANAVQIASLDVGVVGNSAYNLCNVGIVLPPGADGTAAATVNYKVKTNAGL